MRTASLSYLIWLPKLSLVISYLGLGLTSAAGLPSVLAPTERQTAVAEIDAGRWPHAVIRGKHSDFERCTALFIQYRGFEIAGGARVYAFRVINPPETSRDFTVTVQTVAFRSDSLKLQDGPGICYARLSQALQGERQESILERHFSIGERDIQEYLAKHTSPNGRGKKEAI